MGCDRHKWVNKLMLKSSSLLPPRSLVLSTKTRKWRIILQNIWRRVLINISPSNIFPYYMFRQTDFVKIVRRLFLVAACINGLTRYDLSAWWSLPCMKVDIEQVDGRITQKEFILRNIKHAKNMRCGHKIHHSHHRFKPLHKPLLPGVEMKWDWGLVPHRYLSKMAARLHATVKAPKR